ncbi:unnamed protein product, partial [Schistosoma turkestanicum]
DGTEYCTVSNSASLREAIVQMIYNREDNTPLLFASPVVHFDETKLPSFYGGCRPEHLPKDFRERASKFELSQEINYNTTPELPMITELICSVCNQHKWHGDRFTCVVCPRVVLCPRCFKNNQHSEHPMLITRDNAAFPCPVLQAVKIVASDVTVEDVTDDDDDENGEQSDSSEFRTSSSSTSTTTTTANVTATDDIHKTIDRLREMGFKHKNNELIELIKRESGNLPLIVEKLAN